MKRTFAGILIVVIITGAVLLFGCGKKEPAAPARTGGGTSVVGIDLTASLADLKAAAAKMDLPALEKTAKQYMDQITAKQGELTKLMDKFAAIPLAQKMGNEAKALQTDISELTGAVSDLTQRFQVYIAAIQEKGGDVTKFTLSK